MNPFAIILGFVLLALSVFYVASPYRPGEGQKKPGVRGNRRTSIVKLPPEKQRQTVLLALRDLDFDYQAGKIADEDYHTLRADLLSEAAQFLQKQEQQKDESLEALIQSRRKKRLDQPGASPTKASQSSEKQCRNCQTPIYEGAKFCSKCGAPAGQTACSKCGQSILSDDRFCPSCGATVDPAKQITEAKGK